jgi:hypothetical protein
MSDDKIYFYNNQYYSVDDLKNMDRRKRYDIKNRNKRIASVRSCYEKNTDVKKQYGRDYYYYKKEINRLSSIEII